MKLLQRTLLAGVFGLAAITMATLALGDPPADYQTQKDGIAKAYASWKAQCAGASSSGAQSDWCKQEKGRIEAWQKAFAKQFPDQQGDQDQQ